MATTKIPPMVAQPEVVVPNPAPGKGPEGSVVVTAVDPETNTVTLAAVPSDADLDAVAEEEEIKKATAPKPPTAQAVGPSLDSDKKDSLGNDKDGSMVGPRGADMPLDVMTDADKLKVSEAHEARLRKNMASTDGKSSTGTPKGSFQTTPQGVNLHGMKIPDKIDYTKPVDAPLAQIGPRGTGAPQDTYHGAKPVKKD